MSTTRERKQISGQVLSTDYMDYTSNILNYISGLVAFSLVGFIQIMQIKKKGGYHAYLL